MEKLFQRWYDLISIDSVSGHEVGAADYVAEVLRSMGLEPHYSYFPEDTDRQRPSVWTVLDSGKPGKTMLLIGHIDTVDVNLKNWKTNPFMPTEIDGKVYGRGSMDTPQSFRQLSTLLSTKMSFPERSWFALSPMKKD